MCKTNYCSRLSLCLVSSSILWSMSCQSNNLVRQALLDESGTENASSCFQNVHRRRCTRTIMTKFIKMFSIPSSFTCSSFLRQEGELWNRRDSRSSPQNTLPPGLPNLPGDPSWIALTSRQPHLPPRGSPSIRTSLWLLPHLGLVTRLPEPWACAESPSKTSGDTRSEESCLLTPSGSH